MIFLTENIIKNNIIYEINQNDNNDNNNLNENFKKTEKNFECIRCKKKFLNKCDIEKHINKATKCESIYNSIFDTIFNNKQILQMSLVKIKDQPYFFEKKELEENRCKNCFCLYNTKYILNNHMKSCKKDEYDELKRLFDLYHKFLDNNISEININFFSENFNDNHLEKSIKLLFLLNPQPNLVIDKLFSYIKNINILIINDIISLIFDNNNLYKIKTELVIKELIKKIKKYLILLNEEEYNKKSYEKNMYEFIIDNINLVYNNFKNDNLIKNIIKKQIIKFDQNLILHNFNKTNKEFNNLDNFYYFVLNSDIIQEYKCNDENEIEKNLIFFNIPKKLCKKEKNDILSIWEK